MTVDPVSHLLANLLTYLRTYLLIYLNTYLLTMLMTSSCKNRKIHDSIQSFQSIAILELPRIAESYFQHTILVG